MSDYIFNNKITNLVDGASSVEFSLSYPDSITFGNCAMISWKKGKLIFTGDMDASAKEFFEIFLKPYVDDYIKLLRRHNNLDYLEYLYDKGNTK
jgi:hypothetical protein